MRERAEARARAASMRAISSSLTISIGMSGTLSIFLAGKSEDASPMWLNQQGRDKMTVGVATVDGEAMS